MKAMILAAGRGERMRPLTDSLPKPLLDVAGKPLIQWHIERLVAAGICDLIINTAWLGEKLRSVLGDGRQFGARIEYSDEGDAALETGGGIKQALSLLGEEPFWLVNGDIFTDFVCVQGERGSLQDGFLAHLVLVPNPEHNLQGDFVFADGLIHDDAVKGSRYTYSGIALLHPQLIQGDGKFPLAPLLREAARAGRVSAEVYEGAWLDVGTPERLKQAASLAAE